MPTGLLALANEAVTTETEVRVEVGFIDHVVWRSRPGVMAEAAVPITKFAFVRLSGPCCRRISSQVESAASLAAWWLADQGDRKLLQMAKDTTLPCLSISRIELAIPSR